MMLMLYARIVQLRMIIWDHQQKLLFDDYNGSIRPEFKIWTKKQKLIEQQGQGTLISYCIRLSLPSVFCCLFCTSVSQLYVRQCPDCTNQLLLHVPINSPTTCGEYVDKQHFELLFGNGNEKTEIQTKNTILWSKINIHDCKKIEYIECYQLICDH